MDLHFQGKVWIFGDNIDTDVITPGKYIHLPLDELKTHAMKPIHPGFAGDVKPKDVIVAGKNFGCGSSREHAVTVLKSLGLGGVVAVSFARLYLRNAVAHGFPVLIVPQVDAHFEEGDEALVDMEKACITNLRQNRVLQGTPLSADMLAMIKKGGILSLLKTRKP